MRAKSNHYVTGRDGGRDIDLRKFALEGMKLYGHLKDARGYVLHFAPDLKQNLDQADAVAESIKTTIDKYIESAGLEAPVEPRYVPVWQPEREVLELDYVVAGITSIVWSIGFHSDYRWIELPIFDGKGYPGHDRGVCPVPGLYFLGLPWQYTWGSGRFSGVAKDAATPRRLPRAPRRDRRRRRRPSSRSTSGRSARGSACTPVDVACPYTQCSGPLPRIDMARARTTKSVPSSRSRAVDIAVQIDAIERNCSTSAREATCGMSFAVDAARDAESVLPSSAYRRNSVRSASAWLTRPIRRRSPL